MENYNRLVKIKKSPNGTEMFADKDGNLLGIFKDSEGIFHLDGKEVSYTQSKNIDSVIWHRLAERSKPELSKLIRLFLVYDTCYEMAEGEDYRKGRDNHNKIISLVRGTTDPDMVAVLLEFIPKRYPGKVPLALGEWLK